MNNLKNITPTESELEVLQLLWAHGSSSVRFINEELNKKREVGYTTTLKIMQIMHEKGLLSRNTDERSHIYSPSALEDKTKGSLLSNFIDQTFNGSLKSLVLQAIGNGDTNKKEINEIKQLLEDIEKPKSE